MKTSIYFRTLFLIVLTSLVGACTTQVSYNRVYLGNPSLSGMVPLSGKAALVISQSDQDYVFSGSPTSFTGGGTTLNIPLGEINREAARLVFDDLFQDGVEVIAQRPTSTGYAAIIEPTVGNYQYSYNQLKNLGFAITPEAMLAVQVSLVNENGEIVFSKSYDSGLRSGDSYMLSTEPAERISEMTHGLFVELLTMAAKDFHLELMKQQD